LDTVGKIVDRMSELKGLSSQDPMKSEQDRASYNNEFKDLQIQLHDISQMKFNGVSLFAEFTTEKGTTAALFNGADQSSQFDHTISIFTSADGESGSKVSVHKSILLSGLTVRTNGNLPGSITTGASEWSTVVGLDKTAFTPESDVWVTLASPTVSDTIDLQQISVGVITQILENISFLRAQNGGVASRLAFNAESIVQQKTNMRAALGRMVDVDVAEETTNLAKYQVLSQASATILAQANANTELALILLR